MMSDYEFLLYQHLGMLCIGLVQTVLFFALWYETYSNNRKGKK